MLPHPPSIGAYPSTPAGCSPPARSPAGALLFLQAVHTAAHGLIAQEKHIAATAEALDTLQPLLDRLVGTQSASGTDSSQQPAAPQLAELQSSGSQQGPVQRDFQRQHEQQQQQAVQEGQEQQQERQHPQQQPTRLDEQEHQQQQQQQVEEEQREEKNEGEEEEQQRDGGR